MVASPQMLHQLGEVNGQQLVGEVTGALLLSSDPVIILAAAHSFRPLLCALLNLTSINSLRLVQGRLLNLKLLYDIAVNA